MNEGPINWYNVSSLAITPGPAITGHTSTVNGIVQINANQVATSSNDATIKVWNIDNETLVNTYYGHSASVGPMCVLPNGNLASFGGDNTTRVWNMQTQTVSIAFTLSSGISSMMVSPVDGSLVINMPNALIFYNSTSWAVIKSYNTASAYNRIIVVPGTGNVLAVSINWDVWNASGSRIFSQQWDAHSTLDLILLPDNVTAVGCRTSGALHLFNVSANTVGMIVAGHSQSAVALSLTPDQVYIISSGMDNAVILWTWATMTVTKLKTYPANKNAYAMAVVGTPYSGMIFFRIIKLE
jgi:WD40 repeat protein